MGAEAFIAPMGVGYGPSFNPVPTNKTPLYMCNLKADRTATCSVPFSTLTGVNSHGPARLFAAMCPLGAKQALDFYVAFSGSVKNSARVTLPFSQAYSCNSFSNRKCRGYCTTSLFA